LHLGGTAAITQSTTKNIAGGQIQPVVLNAGDTYFFIFRILLFTNTAVLP
jgi:hypothetical protein